MDTYKKYFYMASAWSSGACLIAMTLLILAQVIARFFGVVIPSSEDFAGWILSATIFFGLAYTFNTGGHIRVTILLSRVTGKKRVVMEFFNMLLGLAITLYLSWYSIYTVYESYSYDEVTDTYLAVPLWLIQMPMAIGSTFLFIAMFDNFISLVQGKTPSYIALEEDINVEEGS